MYIPKRLLAYRGYTDIEVVGAGEMDMVYSALQNHEKVIIKKFNPKDTYSEERYERELLLYKEYNHHSIFPKYRWSDIEEMIIETDYIEGCQPSIDFSDIDANLSATIALFINFWVIKISPSHQAFEVSGSIYPQKRKEKINMHLFSEILPMADSEELRLFTNLIAQDVGNCMVLCHGDLHIGNILFKNSEPRFLIDFGKSKFADINSDVGYFMYKLSCGQFMESLPLSETSKVISKILEIISSESQQFNVSKKAIWLYFFYSLYLDYYYITKEKVSLTGKSNLLDERVKEYCRSMVKTLSQYHYDLESL